MNDGDLLTDWAKPYVIAVPMNGVESGSDSRFKVDIDGVRCPVAYHVESKCWYLLEQGATGYVPARAVWPNDAGKWDLETAATAGDLPQSGRQCWQRIELPAVPALPRDAKPLPHTIHYIWLGERGLPDALLANVLSNTRRCPGYRHQLHAHATTAQGWARLAAQFPLTSPIELIDLRSQAHFSEFERGPLGTFFRYFLSEQGRNYAAASDLLRVYLVHREGGIYMDVDDVTAGPATPDFSLYAGPDDILLNASVNVEEYGFDGYTNSNFAAHAGNPVLAEMLREMERRLCTERELFESPRPWRRASEPPRKESPAMLAYIKRIFRLTGPVVFSDVIRACRPDYYGFERRLVRAYELTTVSPFEPRVLADEYFGRMNCAHGFYFPFASSLFKVDVGSAHSWNPPVDGRPHPMLP